MQTSPSSVQKSPRQIAILPQGLPKAVALKTPPGFGASSSSTLQNSPCTLPQSPRQLARLPQGLPKAIAQECPQDLTKFSQTFCKCLHGLPKASPRMPLGFGAHFPSTEQNSPCNLPRSPKQLVRLPQGLPKANAQECPQLLNKISQRHCQTPQGVLKDGRPRMSP